jgi:hypothetical protein
LTQTKEFKGSNGTVIVTPTKVILKYGKFLGSGKGEKEIRLSSITGIQLKKPGITAGYIQFSFSGSSEQKGRSVFDAAKDENTIMCNSKSQFEGFLEAKRLIEEYLDSNNANNNSNSSAPFVEPKSDADEIRKFKQLLDEGIITEEEFMAKKKQILGL